MKDSPLLARELASDVANTTVAGMLLDALTEECVSDAEAELEWFLTTHAYVRARMMRAARELVHERRGRGHLASGVLLVLDTMFGEFIYPVDLVPGERLPTLTGMGALGRDELVVQPSDIMPGCVWFMLGEFEDHSLYTGLRIGASTAIRLAIKAAFSGPPAADAD